MAVSGRYIIRIGDQSTHGGAVITGDPLMTVQGVPVARVGDLHVCPLYWGFIPHGTLPIIPIGCLTQRALVNGRPSAIADDIAGCGAKMIAQQFIGASRC